jgi:AcrR family transcriptional regulator
MTDSEKHLDVLEPAIRVFAREGEVTTIAKIAEEAQLPPSLIYRKFGSRDGILLSIYSLFWSRLLAEIRAATGTDWGDTPLGTLERIIIIGQSFAPKNLDLIRILTTTYLPPPEKIAQADLKKKRLEIRQMNRDVLNIIDQLIQDGQEQSCITKSLSPQVIRQILIGAFQTLAYGLFFQFSKGESVGYSPVEAMNGMKHLLKSISHECDAK